MKYNCEIISIIDDDEVTVRIGGVQLTGFVNSGVTESIGEKTLVDISLYDDLEIFESDSNTVSIMRKGKSFAYSLYGTLNVNKAILESVIDFEIDPEDLFDYGYLDGKKVKIDVKRIDFYFE